MRSSKRARAAFLVVLLILVVPGCGRSAAHHSSHVSERVLADVVAATYPIPGSEIRRGMRIKAFMRGLAIKQCGGTPDPVDSTADRYAQDLFPDLDLIRNRGFSESTDAAESVDPDCALLPRQVRAYVAWMDQGAKWQDLAAGIQRTSRALAVQKPRMAACLRSRTGLHVTEKDPTNFLYSVNKADQDGASRAKYMAWSAAYAACGRAYFAELGSQLAQRRPDLVRQNRELLTTLAAEVVDAGYTP